MPSPYTENGYKSREDYLQSLADEYGAPYHLIEAMSELLGPSEDFDGLVSALNDWTYE